MLFFRTTMAQTCDDMQSVTCEGHKEGKTGAFSTALLKKTKKNKKVKTAIKVL